MRRVAASAAVLLLASAALTCRAGNPDQGPPVAGSLPSGALLAWIPLPDDRLAVVRGGFHTGTGLLVSFGIERAAYVNGALVTTTGFHVAGIGNALAPSAARMHMGDPALAVLPGKSISLVQNGSANLVQGAIGPSAGAGLGATVIQNTLNDQSIRTITTIDAASNSLNMLKSLNVNATLGAAIGAAVGAP